MPSSVLLRRMALVTTAVSEERTASVFRVRRISDQVLFLRSVRRLLVTANAVPSSPILVTLKNKATRFSETSVLTRATRRNLLEDDILHSQCRENFKSYIDLLLFEAIFDKPKGRDFETGRGHYIFFSNYSRPILLPEIDYGIYSAFSRNE
jgi:hypothetical protein